jgi:hypothetical protein
MLLATTKAFADAELQFNKWVETVKIGGDLRLRHEIFDKKTSGQVDRTRERFRLRLNLDFGLVNKFAVKTTLASGTGEQVSTNQSFDGLSSQKSIYIDKAYLTWDPISNLKLQGGRMENPIWRQYSSDVVWDGDFNPEGFSESYSQLVGPVNVFVNALQMVVDEDSGNNSTEGQGTGSTNSQSAKNRDQWMFGNQIGVEFRLPLESRIKVAYANYDWVNERFGDFGAGVNNEGNRRTVASSTGSLVNNFNVNEFTGVLSSWIFKLPVQIQGTYVKNNGVRDTFSPKEDTGWQVGTIIGKAGQKNKWEAAYFRKHVRTDATVADIADSDFGDGGTNREGSIYWVSYSPLDWMMLSAKYFQTQVINPSLAPGADDINRFQLDTVVKF